MTAIPRGAGSETATPADHAGAHGGPEELLAGIRVVDLTSIVMGPLATQLLADFGAEVIKVESPAGGDVLRRVGAGPAASRGPLFLQLNRNKSSVTLDLKTIEGKAALLDLVRGADVLAHSMRPRAMTALGLDWPTLRDINPRLIHAGMFGFDQAGPRAEEGAFDDLIQAASGLADLNGRVTDGHPRYTPFNVSDRVVGLLAFGAISAALAGRERTGRGCQVEVPMFETMASLVLGEHLYGESYNPPRGPMGYPRILVPDRGPFPTCDGHVCAMIYTDAQWRGFLKIVGQDGTLTADPRLADIGARTAHAAELFRFVAGHTRQQPTAWWLDRFAEAGLPAAAANRIEDLPHDPQLAAAGLFETVEDPADGSLRLLRMPVRVNGRHSALHGLPPELGADNRPLAPADVEEERT